MKSRPGYFRNSGKSFALKIRETCIQVKCLKCLRCAKVSKVEKRNFVYNPVRISNLANFLGMTLLVISFWGVFQLGVEASACSCNWNGPFRKVAPQSEVVIRGTVTGYHGEQRGVPLAMDVEVLEIIKGNTNQRRVRIWGDNGWLCRPSVTHFPVGTEWILALNGPGSKPGATPGYYAMSICGQFWLKVIDGRVIGNFDNAQDWQASQELSLEEFRRSFHEQ